MPHGSSVVSEGVVQEGKREIKTEKKGKVNNLVTCDRRRSDPRASKIGAYRCAHGYKIVQVSSYWTGDMLLISGL